MRFLGGKRQKKIWHVCKRLEMRILDFDRASHDARTSESKYGTPGEVTLYFQSTAGVSLRSSPCAPGAGPFQSFTKGASCVVATTEGLLAGLVEGAVVATPVSACVTEVDSRIAGPTAGRLLAQPPAIRTETTTIPATTEPKCIRVMNKLNKILCPN